jgi:hypothetical protein
MFSANVGKNTASQVELVDTNLSQQVQRTVAEVGKALLGKDHQIRLALCCLCFRRSSTNRRPARHGQDHFVLCACEGTRA